MNLKINILDIAWSLEIDHWTFLFEEQVRKSISQNLRSAFLPSSLNYHDPYALVYSTYPPVSVCGTDFDTTPLRTFSRKHNVTSFQPKGRLHS